MITVVVRLFDIPRACPDAGPLAEADVLVAAAKRWSDTPLGRDVAFAGATRRLKPLPSPEDAAALIAAKFPALITLSDKPSADAADARIRWTVALRRGMVVAHARWVTDPDGLAAAAADLPALNRRARACVPDAVEGENFASSIELIEGGPAMPGCDIGRLAPNALAELIDPRCASRPVERRIATALARADVPENVTVTDASGCHLVRWFGEGDDLPTALRRRLAWLSALADPS